VKFGKAVENQPSEASNEPLPDHAAINAASLRVDEARTRLDQAANLAIEDPLEFERQIANGDLDEMLEDADGDPDDGPGDESDAGAHDIRPE
jgi:hypothetical protein